MASGSEWPVGTSGMHERVRSHDWAATPLGPIADWPPSLKYAVDFTLNAGFPTLLLWGRELVQIYNEPYRRFATWREKQLGTSLHANWPAIMPMAAPLFEKVWRGETLFTEQAHWSPPLFRGDRPAWLTISHSPARDEQGNVAGISMTIMDMTQRVLAEATLREKEAQLSQLLELLPVGVTVFDGAGEFIKVNPEMQRLFGDVRLSRVGPIPWQVFDLNGRPLDGDDHPAIRALRGEAARPEADVLLQVDGTRRWVRVGAVPFMRDEKVAGGIVVAHDVTEARENAEHMKLLVAELQHRTRNLIAMVRALADKTLQGSASLVDFQAKFTARLAALARVQGLLSHLGVGERVAFDQLLRAELAAHAAFEGGRVTIEGPPGVRLRSGSVQTLALALHELATNAAKYGALTQKAGRLAVRWRVEDGPARSGRWLHVDWRESGVAMPAADAAAPGGGYGRELIERVLPYQLKAVTSFELGADGVRCTIALRISGEASARVNPD